MEYPIHKLFTKEDVFHIHKVLGILSLGHYIYRMVNIVQHGDSGLSDITPQHATFWIAVHIALSSTSLIFHIPRNRVAKRPMIYPEFRAHSIVFAYRSLLVMLVMVWCQQQYAKTLRVAIAMGTFIAADAVSWRFRAQDTTMRDMPFPDWISEAWRRKINLFYSVSQVFASLIAVYATNIDQVFLMLFPIQIAAFLMTLVRKGLLSAGGWHLMYALSLGLNYVHGVSLGKHDAPMPFLTLVTIFCVLRFRLRMNKYALWASIMCLTLTQGSSPPRCGTFT